MPDDDLAAVLAQIGWPAGELARRLGVRADTVSAWLRGRRAVPPAVITWLIQIRDAQGQAPDLPAGWQRGGDC